MAGDVVDHRRRTFLKIGSVAVTAAAVLSAPRAATAAQPHVDENDPAAQALGYRQDASKADKARFPQYKAGDACGKCKLYQGKAGQSWGACPVFAGKDVSANGWCSAYVRA